MDAMDNLGVLLLELLELYGSAFNYESVGLSIAGRGRYFRKVHRRLVKRRARAQGGAHARRGRFHRSARRQMDRGWAQAGRHSLLSIEDPQDQSTPGRSAAAPTCGHADLRRAILAAVAIAGNDISAGSYNVPLVRQAMEHGTAADSGRPLRQRQTHVAFSSLPPCGTSGMA